MFFSRVNKLIHIFFPPPSRFEISGILFRGCQPRLILYRNRSFSFYRLDIPRLRILVLNQSSFSIHGSLLLWGGTGFDRPFFLLVTLLFHLRSTRSPIPSPFCLCFGYRGLFCDCEMFFSVGGDLGLSLQIPNNPRVFSLLVKRLLTLDWSITLFFMRNVPLPDSVRDSVLDVLSWALVSSTFLSWRCVGARNATPCLLQCWLSRSWSELPSGSSPPKTPSFFFGVTSYYFLPIGVMSRYWSSKMNVTHPHHDWSRLFPFPLWGDFFCWCFFFFFFVFFFVPFPVSSSGHFGP